MMSYMVYTPKVLLWFPIIIHHFILHYHLRTP